jgi:hypothetical protein
MLDALAPPRLTTIVSHLMRVAFLSLLITLTFSCRSHGADLIRGVATFDPPEFLYDAGPGHASDDIFSGVGELRRYEGKDNDIRSGEREIAINVREVGFTIGPGKVVTYQKLDDKALRSWMQATVVGNRHVTNLTAVADARVGNQTALYVSYQVAQPYWPKKPGALFPFEVYWVRFQTNRVLEIELTADTPEHLDTLRPCLARFKITRKDG